MSDAAKRETGFLDGAAIEFKPNRDRHQRKRIRQPVANLDVCVVCRKSLRRQLDRDDQFVGIEIGVALRRVAREPVEIRERDLSFAARTGDMDLCLEHGQRHAHVGRMHRDAGVARAEDRVHPVETANGRAAAARLAFVAGRRRS